MLVMIIINKHTRTYSVLYGSVNPSELDDPDTTSVVVRELTPPSNIILSPGPGSVQQRWSDLSCLSVREGRGETEVPVIFSQDRGDDESQPPHRRPAQEVWWSLSSCRSWTGQELPLDGLYSSTELYGNPPDMRKPGNINNCQTSHRI